MSAPTWESYQPPSIDTTKCIGRRTNEANALRSWAPIVYRPYQCDKAPQAGDDLCKDCRRRAGRPERRHTAEEAQWLGCVGGPIPDDCHIAGSEWCRTGLPGKGRPPKWLGAEKPKMVRKATVAPVEPPTLPPLPPLLESFDAPPPSTTPAKPSRRTLRRLLEAERVAHEATKQEFARYKASQIALLSVAMMAAL